MSIKKSYAEERFEEMLNMRWKLANSDDDAINTTAEMICYNAICTSITTAFGNWKRDENGNHKVFLEKLT